MVQKGHKINLRGCEINNEEAQKDKQSSAPIYDNIFVIGVFFCEILDHLYVKQSSVLE